MSQNRKPRARSLRRGHELSINDVNGTVQLFDKNSIIIAEILALFVPVVARPARSKFRLCLSLTR